MSAPRFRATPHQASEAELQAQNKAWEREGARTRIRASTEDLIERARALTRATRTQLRLYSEHPDERVQLALLSNSNKPWGKQEKVVGADIYLQAVRRVDAEGIVWSPVLDALDTEGLWPGEEVANKVHEERQGKKKPSAPFRHRYAPDQLKSLLDHLYRGQDEDLALEVIDTFRSANLRKGVAYRAFPGERIEARVYTDPSLVHYWMSNRRLSTEMRTRAVEWMMTHLRPESVDAPPTPEGAGALRSLNGIINDQQLNSLLTPELCDRLLSILPDYPPPAAPSTLSWDERRQLHTHVRASLRWPLARMAAYYNDEQRLRAYEQMGDQDHQVAALINHPGATIELLRRAHQEHSSHLVRRALASHSLASADPSIGIHLGARKGEVQQAMLWKGRGAGFRAALLALQERNTEEACRTAWRRFGEIWPDLRPGDLARSLRSRVPRIHETAARLERLLTAMHASEAEFPERLELLLEQFPTDARTLMKYLPEERLTLLPQSLLAGLLSSDSQEMRLRAIRALGKVAERGSTPSALAPPAVAPQEDAAPSRPRR